MKKILLLDDNLDIVQVVEEVLAYEQYEVKSTTTCKNFLQLAEQFRPDLVILDYRLGDGDGGEICRGIKSRPALKHVPVIIFSAYTKPDLDFFDFGCDEFIAKPFNIDYLISTIKRLTGKQLFTKPDQIANSRSFKAI